LATAIAIAIASLISLGLSSLASNPHGEDVAKVEGGAASVLLCGFVIDSN
ncbi:hypothetical protein A2U01_0076523, partial [Trifolium medium]|nr:hypothetical protein [Trifolium medium]